MAGRQARSLALVTGASKGVGRGIALALASVGWDVCVNYHSDRLGAEETATAVRAAGVRSWVHGADVGDGREVSGMFARVAEQMGELRLLVNNAGVQTWGPLLELSEEDWDRTTRTNLKGTFLCTQQAARVMRRRGGAIVNIGSGANRHPFPNLAAYCASKGGVQNLTEVAAVELGPVGIRVNCVAPGAIEVERTREEAEDYAATWSPLTPLGRIGQPVDVADAVVYLASEQARFVTGQTLYVDGGLFSQVPWPYSGGKEGNVRHAH